MSIVREYIETGQPASEIASKYGMSSPIVLYAWLDKYLSRKDFLSLEPETDNPTDMARKTKQHMDQAHGMRVSEPTAERIKMGVGAALTDLKEPPQDMEVIGPNKTTDLPLKVNVTYKEIAQCLEKNITNIEALHSVSGVSLISRTGILEKDS